VTDTKPCYASYPLPGIQPILVDNAGKEIEENEVEGLLCIKFPWPSIIRTTYGDHERCRKTYFGPFPGLYFTGDAARRDPEGRYRIIGRVDDVINVSGHRIGTAEIENAIDEHENVVESAVVGYPHPIKGQGIFAYLILMHPVEDNALLQQEINAKLVQYIGPIAKTDEIMVVSGLPKTRSGKIMRRLLRKAAEGDYSNLGDTSTLLNPEIVDEILAKSKTHQ
jgi:acetyl-CoA synthetase